ncbi:cationic amino acid transporter 8, vacuolar-like [Pistacia vera]|uniref:cationic amino acid transporter 8, vacuolar-like n=1 Tax=Pistacia vera TaxID=55513 RepID=UPI001262CBB2|nr:cationic amino acid transporter 8, vacuolar-like [Pistacia vera]
MVATMVEGTKRPARDIPIGLVGSMSMITVIYCLMALALTMVVKYTQIDINAAYSVAFEQIGMKWAKYLCQFSPFGANGFFEAATVVYWSYTGFDMVATMAEETKRPARDIPIGLVGSMSMITVIYCLMALALTMVVKYTQIDINAAYLVAFEQIGMKWAKYLLNMKLPHYPSADENH